MSEDEAFELTPRDCFNETVEWTAGMTQTGWFNSSKAGQLKELTGNMHLMGSGELSSNVRGCSLPRQENPMGSRNRMHGCVRAEVGEIGSDHEKQGDASMETLPHETGGVGTGPVDQYVMEHCGERPETGPSHTGTHSPGSPAKRQFLSDTGTPPRIDGITTGFDRKTNLMGQRYGPAATGNVSTPSVLEVREGPDEQIRNEPGTPTLQDGSIDQAGRSDPYPPMRASCCTPRGLVRDTVADIDARCGECLPESTPLMRGVGGHEALEKTGYIGRDVEEDFKRMKEIFEPISTMLDDRYAKTPYGTDGNE